MTSRSPIAGKPETGVLIVFGRPAAACGARLAVSRRLQTRKKR
jgi:hypothetical protein